MALTRDDFYDEQLLQTFPELAAEQFYNEDALRGTLTGNQRSGNSNPLTAGFGQTADQVREIAQQLFPNQNMSDADLRRLSNLQARQLQLQPLQAPQMQGSTRIAGNPYSYDRSPVFNAIQQGLTQLINARRQKKLLGDPEEAQELRSQGGPGRSSVINQMIEERAREAEGVLPQLSRLQNQQAQSQQAQQSQDEFFMQMFPDVAGRMMDVRGNLAEEGVRQQGRIGLEELRGTQRQELENLRQTNRVELENLKNTLDTDGPDNIPPSTITNFANTGKQSADVLFRQSENISEVLNDPIALRNQARTEGKTVENLRTELQNDKQKKENQAWRLLSVSSRAGIQAGLDEDLVNEYQDVINQLSGNNNTGGALDDL